MKCGKIYYEVTPKVRNAMSWKNIGDAGNAEKSIWFNFDDSLLTSAKLYAARVRKGDQRYAKLKIELYGRVSTVFLDEDVVRFGERYHGQHTE